MQSFGKIGKLLFFYNFSSMSDKKSKLGTGLINKVTALKFSGFIAMVIVVFDRKIFADFPPLMEKSKFFKNSYF